ncbi:MAG: hypothetical protein CL927_12705 [Deltaproteobacteria bacterium]|nr:hypothetical protein [Deltaproteobacteria bacterium]HCH66584.1 hypothetical protein [Deltaproteobacteria bacterium]
MSAEQPPGVFPLIFESGVVHIDEEGVLHVHLTHSSDAPHPVVTHPDGGETTIPGGAAEAHISGGPGTNTRVRSSLRETDTLPEGFVFHIRGWQLLQLEMSGDLTVVVEGVFDPPSWFQAGKVHRFDGPDEGVTIFKDSHPLVAAQPAKPSRPIPEWTPSSRSARSSSSSSGCGLLLALLVLAAGLSVVPILV